MYYPKLQYNAGAVGQKGKTTQYWTIAGYDENVVSFQSIPTSNLSRTELLSFELTGYHIGDQYQTTYDLWVIASQAQQLPSDDSRVSKAEAQRLINALTANNKRVYENTLLLSRFQNKLDSNSRYQLERLKERLRLRDTALRLNSNLTDKQESYPAGYVALADSYGSMGVVITTTALIIISAVVVASMATAVYFAFRAWYKESEQDVKFSDELTKTLMSKLTPEEYAQLMSETKGMVTKAKLEQRFATMFATTGGLLKWALIGTGAYMLYDAYKKGKLKF